ncbi:MAG: sensor histidine kinase, partial [Usitatibacteraceae bacterium]
LELIDVNDAWERVFETSRDAALAGKDSQLQILAPGDAYTHMNTEMAANRAVLDYSITARTPSGKVLSLLVSCVRLVAAQSDYQLTTAIDLTERVQTESALRDSEACFSAIVATLVEGIVLVQNVDGRAMFCNPAALRILGISLPELRGDAPRNPNWQIRDGDGTALTPAGWPSSMVVESGNPVLGRHLIVIRPDGSKCDITVNAMPFEAASLGAHGTLLTITDRTAEYKSLTDVQSLAANLGDKVTHRTAELEEANAELRTFSYSVSHDLRSPLRAIDGFAQLLNDRHGHELSPEAKRHLDRVLQSTKRMNGIIDDLLMLARVTQADISYVTLNVSELATTVAEQLATDKARQVEWQIESGIEINADPGLIRIVLENLLGNAWKYSARTAVAKISLRANAELPEGYVGFVVEDNGVGFDQKYVERLFSPFRRLHAETEFSGSGVGLATVKRAIARHGGNVRAEGVTGSGARFWVTLPRHRRDE